ncbi:MAG: methylmalonyl-CoA mutase cobalamin-binding subunit [Planctomycetota bacterium]|jgi:methylmalonyl-CoA mutase cobalamin-binding subunit
MSQSANKSANKKELNPDEAAQLAVRQAAAETFSDFNHSIAEARAIAASITPGRSLFLDKFQVSSELEYKQQCLADGRIMYHAHIGMNDMAITSTALQSIHRELDARGYRLDRAGFAIDRRMGLPEENRESAAAETGPMLMNDEDWSKLSMSAPIQPHMGDFMIGQPASVANTVKALRIGCTTVGNLSQYFTFEAPGWSDTRHTTVQTCQAIMILSDLRKQGAMLHSYLEDGYGALFKRCATVAAWAMLEYYIVEELLGARLSHCIGGLTSDPVKRAGWVLCLQKIHRGEHIGSMIYGDTISFGRHFEKNRAITAEYLMWDILAQMHCPSGHAVLPLPVTEAIRIPSADEIIEAQLFGRQVEASARRLYPHIDFSEVESFADSVFNEGRVIFDNAISGLRDLGIDMRNPLQLLYLLKKLGAQHFEQLYGIKSSGDQSWETDMFALSRGVIDDYRPLFADPILRRKVNNKIIVVASTDVHQHASGALAQLLSEAGAKVINLGAEQNPSDLVAALNQQQVDVLMISTHNGMALDYGRQLRQLLDASSVTVPVIMGGVLNQKVEGVELPVMVIDELQQLGFYPATSLPGLTKLIPFQE